MMTVKMRMRIPICPGNQEAANALTRRKFRVTYSYIRILGYNVV